MTALPAHPSPPAGPADPTAGTVPAGVALLGWVAALAVPLWVGAGRFLTGTAGDLALVYALTLVPVLLVLSVVALAVPGSRPARRPSVRAMVALGLAWICGLGLGLTLPDTGEGASSVLEAWAGPEMSGVAAALSNPFAILMVLLAAIGCVLAVRDSRPGGPSRVTDEDDRQGTGRFPLLDV
ncbi:hypothetical protein [Micrococcus sp. IITD107]|uniref:hypothetical protein n=1 Tax=Micrococcus sp. IITD107 TaxID=3342790 RepID=UPI0035BA3209